MALSDDAVRGSSPPTCFVNAAGGDDRPGASAHPSEQGVQEHAGRLLRAAEPGGDGSGSASEWAALAVRAALDGVSVPPGSAAMPLRPDAALRRRGAPGFVLRLGGDGAWPGAGGWGQMGVLSAAGSDDNLYPQLQEAAEYVEGRDIGSGEAAWMEVKSASEDSAPGVV